MIPVIDPDYARKALEAKSRAFRNRHHAGTPLLAGALAGLVCGGAWWAIDGADPTPAFRRIMAGTVGGMVVSMYVHGIRRLRHPPPRGVCPACGHDWERPRLVDGMTAFPEQWDKCPGCGAVMTTELLEIAIARSLGLSGLAVSEYLERQHREQA